MPFPTSSERLEVNTIRSFSLLGKHRSSLSIPHSPTLSSRINSAYDKYTYSLHPLHEDPKKFSVSSPTQFSSYLDLVPDWDSSTLHILIDRINELISIVEPEVGIKNNAANSPTSEIDPALQSPINYTAIQDLALTTSQAKSSSSSKITQQPKQGQNSFPNGTMNGNSLCYKPSECDFIFAQPKVKISSTLSSSFAAKLPKKKSSSSYTKLLYDPLCLHQSENEELADDLDAICSSTLFLTSHWVKCHSSSSASLSILDSPQLSTCTSNCSTAVEPSVSHEDSMPACTPNKRIKKRDFKTFKVVGGWGLKKDNPEFRLRAEKIKRKNEYGEKLRAFHAGTLPKKKPHFEKPTQKGCSLKPLEKPESPVMSSEIITSKRSPTLKRQVRKLHVNISNESCDDSADSLDEALEQYFFDLELVEKIKVEFNI